MRTALEDARIKARKALQHLNACQEHVKTMESQRDRTKIGDALFSVRTSLLLTAQESEKKAQEAYIDAHAELYDAQQDAGMNDTEIDQDREWVTAGHLAREGE
jgi:hypothetical protein